MRLSLRAKSLQFKILSAAIIVTLLGTGLLTLYFTFNLKQVYLNTLKEQQLDGSRDAAYLIRENLLPLQELVTGTASDLQNYDLSNLDAAHRFIDNEAQNRRIVGDLYFGRQSDGAFIQSNSRLQLPPGYDPRARGWYKQAVAANGFVLTDPYVDAFTGKFCVTMAAPVMKNNQLQGVVGVDVYLDSLQQFISQVRVGQKGYAYIVNDQGTIVAHPNSNYPGLNMTNPTDDQLKKAGLSRETFNRTFQPLWQQLQKGESGELNYINSTHNLPVFGHFAAVPGFPWKIVYVANDQEVASAVNGLFAKSALIGVLIILAVCLLLWFVTYRSLAPVKEIIAALQAVSAGDFTTEVKVNTNDEIGEIGRSLNNMLGNLRASLARVREATATVASSAEEISASTQQIANGSQNQASDIQRIAGAIEEISGAAKNLSEYVRDMAFMTGDTVESATSGQQALEANFNSVEEASNRVKELNASAGKVKEILNIINEIADQTNLLALNAAIEAARAGEHGRGFSVVAEEVRKLAERSIKATAEIAEVIKEIQQNMEHTLAAVEHGDQLGRKAVESFKTIKIRIEDLAAKVNEIEKVAQNQAALTDEVARAGQNISAVTEEISATIEENSAASQELAATADEMARSVAQFKI